jgi:hypothetical protein
MATENGRGLQNLSCAPHGQGLAQLVPGSGLHPQSTEKKREGWQWVLTVKRCEGLWGEGAVGSFGVMTEL